MIHKDSLYHIISLIPYGKVISYKTLADIFFTTPSSIKKRLHNEIYNIVPSSWICVLWIKQKNYLSKQWIIIHNNKVSSRYFRKPVVTNHYVSLITQDQKAIDEFAHITKKILLLHPWHIIKKPTHYHITLADCSGITLHKTLIDHIFTETDWLLPFYFHCILQKPHIDTKKEKVVFWIRLQNNPFLLTLHQCIKKYIPWRATKPYIPHITLWKIVKTSTYNKKFDSLELDIMCEFNTMCITANIDNNKDIILFSHTLG